MERPIRERLRNPRTLDLDDLVSLPGQVLQIVPLVDRATLHEDVEQRIVEMRPLDPAICGLDVQVREVPAVEMPDQVGGVRRRVSPCLIMLRRFLERPGHRVVRRVSAEARWYAPGESRAGAADALVRLGVGARNRSLDDGALRPPRLERERAAKLDQPAFHAGEADAARCVQ